MQDRADLGREELELVGDRREGREPELAPVLIGFRGDRPVRLEPPHAYLECHIEQGPVLAQEDRPVGIVTGVQSISWQKVTLHGRAAHAGTTPTELRIDAGLAAAQIIIEVRRMVDSGRYGRLRATVGHIEASPGLRVESAQMARTKAIPFAEEVQDALEAAAKERGYDSMRLMSGAGHDAQEMAAIAPASAAAAGR